VAILRKLIQMNEKLKIDFALLPDDAFIYRGNMALSADGGYASLNKQLAEEGPRLRVGPVLDPSNGDCRPDWAHAAIGTYLGESLPNEVNCVVEGKRITLEDAIKAQQKMVG